MMQLSIWILIRSREGLERDLAYTRAIGDRLLNENRALAMAVPSVVLADSINVLLNPLHPRAVELRIIERQPFKFDPRLRRAGYTRFSDSI